MPLVIWGILSGLAIATFLIGIGVVWVYCNRRFRQRIQEARAEGFEEAQRTLGEWNKPL